MIAFKADMETLDMIEYLGERWGTKNKSRIVRRALQIAYLMTEFARTGSVDFYIKARKIIMLGSGYHGDLLKAED